MEPEEEEERDRHFNASGTRPLKQFQTELDGSRQRVHHMFQKMDKALDRTVPMTGTPSSGNSPSPSRGSWTSSKKQSAWVTAGSGGTAAVPPRESRSIAWASAEEQGRDTTHARSRDLRLHGPEGLSGRVVEKVADKVAKMVVHK